MMGYHYRKDSKQIRIEAVDKIKCIPEASRTEEQKQKLVVMEESIEWWRKHPLDRYRRYGKEYY